MTEPTDITALLAERFPAAFFVYERRRRPLKVGIHVDILERTAGSIEPQELTRALRYYTANAGYLAAMQPGAARIDLDGMPSGIVTAEQAEAAGRQLSKRKQRVPASAAPPEPPAMKRASLADLRAAAQRRNAAAQHKGTSTT